MDSWELSACVVVNLENMAKMDPMIRVHPLYALVLGQAKDLEAQLGERGREAMRYALAVVMVGMMVGCQPEPVSEQKAVPTYGNDPAGVIYPYTENQL